MPKLDFSDIPTPSKLQKLQDIPAVARFWGTCIRNKSPSSTNLFTQVNLTLSGETEEDKVNFLAAGLLIAIRLPSIRKNLPNKLQKFSQESLMDLIWLEFATIRKIIEEVNPSVILNTKSGTFRSEANIAIARIIRKSLGLETIFWETQDDVSQIMNKHKNNQVRIDKIIIWAAKFYHYVKTLTDMGTIIPFISFVFSAIVLIEGSILNGSSTACSLRTYSPVVITCVMAILAMALLISIAPADLYKAIPEAYKLTPPGQTFVSYIESVIKFIIDSNSSCNPNELSFAIVANGTIGVSLANNGFGTHAGIRCMLTYEDDKKNTLRLLIFFKLIDLSITVDHDDQRQFNPINSTPNLLDENIGNFKTMAQEMSNQMSNETNAIDEIEKKLDQSREVLKRITLRELLNNGKILPDPVKIPEMDSKMSVEEFIEKMPSHALTPLLNAFDKQKVQEVYQWLFNNPPRIISGEALCKWSEVIEEQANSDIKPLETLKTINKINNFQFQRIISNFRENMKTEKLKDSPLICH